MVELLSWEQVVTVDSLKGATYDSLFWNTVSWSGSATADVVSWMVSSWTEIQTVWQIENVTNSWTNQWNQWTWTVEYIKVPQICEYTWSALASLESWTELEKAVYWMYQNGLTSYMGDDFLPKQYATRQEAAKFIWQLYKVLWFEEKDKGIDCNFVDADKFEPTLREHIMTVCKLWIFKWTSDTHEYLPWNNLTKWEILTVLIRILEDKYSDESMSPRWLEYYVKAKILWITNEKNLNNIDRAITREEIALLLYRYKNLLIRPDGCSDKQNVVSKISWNLTVAIQQVAESRNHDENNTGFFVNNIGTIDLWLLAWNTSLVDDPEFKEAVNWMYDQKITNKTMDEFDPFQSATRWQIAKMIDKFAIATNLNAVRNTDCDFIDIETSEFKDSIIRVCQLGVMGGVWNEFNPEGVVKKADFIAMLIRLFEGKKLDENVNPRWLNYYEKAIDLSLISAQDTVTFDKEISRYEIATFLYRLKVRITMYNNLNENVIPDEIISTLEDTTWTWEKKSALVSVDMTALNNYAFSDWYIELFGNRYKIKKTTTNSYNIGVNSFVWYGIISDFVSWENIGIINFIITNKNLTEWTIRLLKDNTSFKLIKDETVNPYFQLREI